MTKDWLKQNSKNVTVRPSLGYLQDVLSNMTTSPLMWRLLYCMNKLESDKVRSLYNFKLMRNRFGT